jgi:hypothetical protein
MEINVAPGIAIDPQVVITGRCCIIGQSGSGKSYLVGVMAEELCNAGLPFAIIDTEGEYSSLKPTFKIILVGMDNADLNINTDATKLFKSSIVNNVPIIFDLSEVIEKDIYVESLLAALYAIEDTMRTPYLVIIEEADKFAPQVIHRSKNMVEEISVRGRKRGIGLIVATQRPANISKNVLAQCSYGFIGKLTTDNDIRAIDLLFNDKKKLFDIPKLSQGEFMTFGLKYDAPFNVKQRTVTSGGSTPKIRISESQVNFKEIIGKLNEKVVSSPTAGNKAARREGNRVIKVNAIKENISMEDAEEYAKRISQKKFLIFGDAVESIDEIKKNYLYLVLSKIRIPLRKKGMYEEHNILIDSKLRVISMGNSVNADWFGGEKQFSLNEDEAKVFSTLNMRNGCDPYNLARQTGLDEYQMHSAIRKLSKLELVYEKKEKLYAANISNNMNQKVPDIAEVSVDLANVVNYSDKLRKAAQDRIMLMFPHSQILNIEPVYLPFYSITLRKGSRVKVELIDAIFGNKLEIL